MSRHESFLKQATAVALSSNHPRWRLGALVVRGASRISAGANVPRNDPDMMQGGPGTTTHAEVNALRRLTYQADRAEGCTLYVARVGRSGHPRLARPCARCYETLVTAGIRTIIYTTNDGYGIERVHSTF